VGEVDAASSLAVQPAGRHYTPIEMVRSPIFWIMYVMFVLVGAGGLMATAQLAPIAKDFNLDAVPVSLVGITLPALTFALSLDRISMASRDRSSAGSPTSSAARTRCLSPSASRHWAFGCSACSAKAL
jgi:hypothetical protein